MIQTTERTARTERAQTSETDELPKAARAGVLLALLAATAIIAVMLTAACAHRPKSPPGIPLTPSQRELEVASFDQVWTTIRDKHWDSTKVGADWEAARDSLRPKVESAVTREQSLAAMTHLIDRLGQSHFGIIPNTIYQDLDAGPRGEGRPGFDLRVVDEQALVVSVEPGSPAESLGVRPGWVISRVRDQDVAAVLDKLSPQFEGKTLRDLVLTNAVLARLSGSIGEIVAVRFLDGGDRRVDLDVPLVAPRGNRVSFGNIPPMYAYFDSRELEGGILYTKISVFFDPGRIMTAFGEAIESNLDAPGLILDLRGNPGGIGAMAMGVAGWLVEGSDRELGVMQTRGSRLKFSISPRARTYGGPVALLVDGLSASSSEVLVAGLQDLGRARVFGTRTAGAALPSTIEKLPNGDGFQYAFANYTSTGGAVLEGRGVEPDEKVVADRASLLSGRDPVLDAAVAWIRRSRE
ncbi:MAG: S41 family peptidase [Candidatus Eisenbacteria bacterium]|nr:S41 family peptidase [Candidatus Eisenbacteria bacterium]